nr:BrnA antitoxin family protein [uncultured Rhodopila sp.]
MISDEPDEDADCLDDDALIEAYTGIVLPPTPEGPGPADWPPRRAACDPLTVDADVLAWFKANQADWQRRIPAILRGWIAAQSKPAQHDTAKPDPAQP